MPRKKDPSDEVDIDTVLHAIEVDQQEDSVTIPLLRSLQIIEHVERPLEVLGLYMIYKTLYQERKHVPSAKTLRKKLNIGRDKLKDIRSIMKEEGFIEDVTIKDDSGKFLTKITKLRTTGFPSDGKHVAYIINNIDTPDFPAKKSGCSSSKDSKEGKPKTSKLFPRLQDFDRLWNINRHPVNKEESRRAWKSQPVQKGLPQLDLLLEAYEADAKANDWDNADLKHIPHLSTWLRGKRWQNHTGEPVDSSGGVHIMAQLKRSDGIESAKQLRDEINENCESRGGKVNKSFTRKYVKWL